MNLPKVIADLIKSQNDHDSVAYAHCFSETAVVVDEGETYKGRGEIQHWIEKANEEYNTKIQPIEFNETETICVLAANVSGTFPGSPIILNYQFELKNGLIQSINIMG